MKNKVVYVTGHRGFIGSHIAKSLLDRGNYVIGVDSLNYASRGADDIEEFDLNYDKFRGIYEDINDLEFLFECDYIINTAAETHVGNSIVSHEEFVNANIHGVYNILNLLHKYRGEQSKKPILIHFSTDEVYGDITEGAHTEKDILKPSNPYSATKAAADMLIQAWGRTYNLPYIIVRPTNNYGIGQYVEKLIPKTIKYLGLNKKIPLHNGGKPYRNWLHVEDTVNAIIHIMEHGELGEIYNISGGFEQSNIDTVKAVIDEYFEIKSDFGAFKMDYSKYIDFSYDRPGQDVRYSLDDSKLRALGWEPERKFNLEIPKIVKHYKDHFIW